MELGDKKVAEAWFQKCLQLTFDPMNALENAQGLARKNLAQLSTI